MDFILKAHSYFISDSILFQRHIMRVSHRVDLDPVYFLVISYMLTLGCVMSLYLYTFHFIENIDMMPQEY